MSAEQEQPQRLPLKGIYINFRERAIEFEDDHGTVGRIVFAGETILVEGQPLTVAVPVEAAEPPAEPVGVSQPLPQQAAPAAPRGAPEGREQEPTVVLSGRLLSQPQADKPDARGKPTAWARFGAQVDGEDEAHLYSATFHKQTAPIALGLTKGSPVTVEGYAHPSTDPTGKRLDTFSVIHLVNYPGKPDKQLRRSPRPRS